MTLGSLDALLSPKKIAHLETRHWAGVFRSKALQVLLRSEATFAPLFREENGRPNKPVAAIVGLLILKEMFDLADDTALGGTPAAFSMSFACASRSSSASRIASA